MTFSYRPSGVCSTMIDLELEDGIIQSVRFTGRPKKAAPPCGRRRLSAENQTFLSRIW